MPNWCNNIVTLKHKDPALIKRIAEEGEKGLFNLFVPMPEQLRNTEKSTATPDEVYQKNIEQFGYASWYEWAHDNWGTKWDACDVNITEQSENSIDLCFDTAWSPPIPFFEAMYEQGFEVEAYYSEPGMCFCGTYQDGSDHYVEYNATSLKALRLSCPAEFIEMFSLDDWFEEEEAE